MNSFLSFDLIRRLTYAAAVASANSSPVRRDHGPARSPFSPSRNVVNVPAPAKRAFAEYVSYQTIDAVVGRSGPNFHSSFSSFRNGHGSPVLPNATTSAPPAARKRDRSPASEEASLKRTKSSGTKGKPSDNKAATKDSKTNGASSRTVSPLYGVSQAMLRLLSNSQYSI